MYAFIKSSYVSCKKKKRASVNGIQLIYFIVYYFFSEMILINLRKNVWTLRTIVTEDNICTSRSHKNYCFEAHFNQKYIFVGNIKYNVNTVLCLFLSKLFMNLHMYIFCTCVHTLRVCICVVQHQGYNIQM